MSANGVPEPGTDTLRAAALAAVLLMALGAVLVRLSVERVVE